MVAQGVEDPRLARRQGTEWRCQPSPIGSAVRVLDPAGQLRLLGCRPAQGGSRRAAAGGIEPRERLSGACADPLDHVALSGSSRSSNCHWDA